MNIGFWANHESKCEECGVLFNRRGQLFVCPACRERMKKIKLPPSAPSMFSNIRGIKVAERILTSDHPGFRRSRNRNGNVRRGDRRVQTGFPRPLKGR